MVGSGLGLVGAVGLDRWVGCQVEPRRGGDWAASVADIEHLMTSLKEEGLGPRGTSGDQEGFLLVSEAAAEQDEPLVDATFCMDMQATPRRSRGTRIARATAEFREVSCLCW